MGTDVPLQLVLLLSLDDDKMPVESDLDLSLLPLFYPFKYSYGGAQVQYAVRSDSQIEILHMSDALPNDPSEQYLRVDELPIERFDLTPLIYEQARILAFLEHDGSFSANDDDRRVLSELDASRLVRIGGKTTHIKNAPDVICRNKECEFFHQRTYFQKLATLPPIAVNGDDGFWCEFQGGDVTFVFGICTRCGSVIAFNVAD